MRIVCISDTHNRHERIELPDGDLLLHAGDLTQRGTPAELNSLAEWFVRQQARFGEVVAVAGNHDVLLQKTPVESRALLRRSCTYLEDSGTEWNGLRIWGSPWQPMFFNMAFNLRRGEPLADRWRLIPDDTDILLTHTPPMDVLDQTFRGQHVGSETLNDAMERVRPGLHVFGHIHEAYGVRRVRATTYVNAASVNLSYEPVNRPIVLDYDETTRTFTLVSGGC